MICCRLDGCRIIGLGNGVLEIQSPSSPATSTSAIAKKVASGDEVVTNRLGCSSLFGVDLPVPLSCLSFVDADTTQLVCVCVCVCVCTLKLARA